MCLLYFLTLILSQPWHNFPRWNIPTLQAALVDKRAPPLPMTNAAVNPGFSKPRFQKKIAEAWFRHVIAP